MRMLTVLMALSVVCSFNQSFANSSITLPFYASDAKQISQILQTKMVNLLDKDCLVEILTNPVHLSLVAVGSKIESISLRREDGAMVGSINYVSPDGSAFRPTIAIKARLRKNFDLTTPICSIVQIPEVY